MNCNNTPKCSEPCGDCTQEWPRPAGAQSPAEGDEVRDAAQALIDHLWKTHLAGIQFHLVADLKQALDAQPQPKGTQADVSLTNEGNKPAPEPVAWCQMSIGGKSIAYFDGKPMVMVGPVGNHIHTTPLYLHPSQAPAPAPDADPLFLLHCGQIDSSGEQDDWDIEADSGKRVEEFCRLHPGQTVNLYPHVQYPAVVDGTAQQADAKDARTDWERGCDAYNRWCNDQDIHCNRLPSFRELDAKEQARLVKRASMRSGKEQS